jgi:multiple sugar transport system ATP-binding protein
MANVVLKDVRKAHGQTEILKGIDLEVDDGEFIVFVGPSGCGKSTLLRVIAGLESITSGSLSIDNQVVNDLPPSKRGVSMVFQSYALYPHMTVRENISFGLRLAKAGKTDIAQAVEQAAEILQLSALLDRKPKELSGGQRQRVAIGRAIVRKPGVFLFDEPLSNLDAALRVHMRVEIAKLHQDLGKTMIYVTHDQVEAMTLADRIVVLNAGRIEQVGTPLELYSSPKNIFVAGFIGSPKMNFIDVKPIRSENGESQVRLPCSNAIQVPVAPGLLELNRKLTVGIRPEHITVAQNGSDNKLTGTVKVVERLGDVSYLHVETNRYTDPLMMRVSPDSNYKVGDDIRISLPRAHCYVFAEDGQRIPPLNSGSPARLQVIGQ